MNEYVRIRSYHIIRTWTRVPGGFITLCGRRGQSNEWVADFGNEKTCESCLRIARKAT